MPSEILDIGKLLELGIDFKKLSREHVYCQLSPVLSHQHIHEHLLIQIALTCVSFSLLGSSNISGHLDGKSCAIFAPDKVRGNTPGQFVSKPFVSWVKMSGGKKGLATLD